MDITRVLLILVIMLIELRLGTNQEELSGDGEDDPVLADISRRLKKSDIGAFDAIEQINEHALLKGILFMGIRAQWPNSLLSVLSTS